MVTILKLSQFQETGSWIREVLFIQFRMEFLPMVLFWWRSMWICQFPHIWVEGLETNVCKCLLLFKSSLLNVMSLTQLLIWNVKLHRFFFDFSMTYVGAGMICSHLVNVSLLLGAVLSWGVMWPLIGQKKGEWFPQDIKESSMKSLNGYKVCV